MKHTPILDFTRPAGREVPLDPADPALLDRARRELAFAALRRRRLPGRRVGDIDWLVLLELFVAHAEGHALQTKFLVHGTAPLSTLLRYLDSLEADDLIVRQTPDHDRRITLVRATERGLARTASILSEGADFEVEASRAQPKVARAR